MAGVARPAVTPYPGDSQRPSLSTHSQQTQRGSDSGGLLLRGTAQHHQLAKPHLPPTPARLHALSTQNPPQSRRQARTPLPATPPSASPWQRDPGRTGWDASGTHNHVLQGVLGKPAVQKHGDEQIPQRRPKYLPKARVTRTKIHALYQKKKLQTAKSSPVRKGPSPN